MSDLRTVDLFFLYFSLEFLLFFHFYFLYLGLAKENDVTVTTSHNMEKSIKESRKMMLYII